MRRRGHAAQRQWTRSAGCPPGARRKAAASGGAARGAPAAGGRGRSRRAPPRGSATSCRSASSTVASQGGAVAV
eukprot:6575287-Alexandrium_andersonii.AAC.1